MSNYHDILQECVYIRDVYHKVKYRAFYPGICQLESFSSCSSRTFLNIYINTIAIYPWENSSVISKEVDVSQANLDQDLSCQSIITKEEKFRCNHPAIHKLWYVETELFVYIRRFIIWVQDKYYEGNNSIITAPPFEVVVESTPVEDGYSRNVSQSGSVGHHGTVFPWAGLKCEAVACVGPVLLVTFLLISLASLSPVEWDSWAQYSLSLGSTCRLRLCEAAVSPLLAGLSTTS